jgi:molecular chaperone DnaK (HSP70)
MAVAVRARQAVGIDLGTTSSALAYIRDSKPHLVADGAGKLIMPSTVTVSKV